MLTLKKHIGIFLSNEDGNVLEFKSNLVKFPYGMEKANSSDLTQQEREAISFVTSSVEIINKEANLRKDSTGEYITDQVGKTFTVGEFAAMLAGFNLGNAANALSMSIPEIGYEYEYVAVASVDVTPATASKEQGETQQFSATIAPAEAHQSVTWSLESVEGLTIDQTGLVTIGESVPADSYTVTATSVADPSKTSTATLTVTEATG